MRTMHQHTDSGCFKQQLNPDANPIPLLQLDPRQALPSSSPGRTTPRHPAFPTLSHTFPHSRKDVLLVLARQALPGGVAGVDDHQAPHHQPLLPRLVQLLPQVLHVQRPARCLIKQVWNQLAAVQRQRRGVQRVLRRERGVQGSVGSGSNGQPLRP